MKKKGRNETKMLNEISEILTRIDEENLDKAVEILLEHKPSHRIFLVGNGGSSACASHFASDLASLGFDATCLSDNIPRLTAITNDFGWEDVFIKQLEHLKPNDILIVISVHGGSNSWSCNLVRAASFAKEKGAKILSLSGFDGGELAKISDLSIIVPAERTYIIEGLHSVVAHVICQKLENK
jgi:D-sedoheptulose 7-phosphate isomerase